MPRGLPLAVLAIAVAACGRQAPSPPASLGISVPYEVAGLDPHAENTLSSVAVTSHLFEPLVTTDPEMRIQPCLARAWENPDPLTWIFRLRPGVHFHDGSPLTARDVVYSLRRLRDSPGLHLRSYLTLVDQVDAEGPLSVRVSTTKPVSVLLNRLRMVAIVPEGAGAQELNAVPAGTGPYLLAEWRAGRSLRLLRNEGYWGTKPHFAGVTLHLDRSPREARDDLLSGRSRIAQCNSTRLRGELTARGFRAVSRPSLFVQYVGFDVWRPATPYASAASNPFRDRRVREALHLAVDRRRLVADLSVPATPAHQPIPPYTFGHNPHLAETVPDADRARRLLRQAGLGQGFAAVLHARNMFAEAAASFRDQLAPLGIRIEVQLEADGPFISRARRRDTSLFLSRIGAPTGDASDILDTAFHSPDTAGFLGGSNFGNYSNREVDAGILRSVELEPAVRRRALLGEVMERLMGDLPWVPLYTGEDVYVLAPGLRWSPRGDGLLLAAEVAGR